MTWLTDEQTMSAARERAEKALRIPLGMASPLWLAFGAAASVGVTLWWMTRWTKAVNLEAMTPFAPATPALTLAEPALGPEIVAESAIEPVVEAAAPLTIAGTPKAAESEAAAPAAPAVESTPVERAPAVVASAPKAAPVKHAATAPEPDPAAAPDDLTRLVGIGPKLAEALAARGVTRFSHIAAWTANDLAKVDSELKLLGRAARDAWVAQARRFAAERN
jgi:predicted flap endonuclease-1-like 5' DNA nuclease